ncbi:MAG: hypothetical protein K6T33_05235 [Thermomonas hydrothermalis]|uniref:hypothetical protein n=1 Tax=Thermomonas hydrothermalis TaxID=213588 RepID=UPI0023553229|nr:hypothetical protein [Thermomonas hydrothermalis]MCL6619176.1 hypothetical protein [Thermomonas hydrothermalis]
MPSRAIHPTSHADAEPGLGVLRLADIGLDAPRALLARFGLTLVEVAPDAPIPGSYWGAPEAGIIGTTVYARADTPVHSLLHEAGHLIVLPPDKRASVHTDATDSVIEEDAVCVLQGLLADVLPGVGRHRLWADMDAWGYTFRLGSTRAYVEQDAEHAWDWLRQHGLVDAAGTLVLPE